MGYDGEAARKQAMTTENPNDRLSQINTIWSNVEQVQAGSSAAQQDLFQRYEGAVRRYLAAAVGDAAAAEDLTQEFALALVQSKFRRADPQRGRFRDYIKGVLFHLLRQYRRQQKKHSAARSRALDEQLFCSNPQSDRHFQQSWRDELLARTWAALADAQADFFTVLHFRAAHPDMTSDQMAQELGPQLGKTTTAERVRQTLHRARKSFADLLLKEVSRSLSHPTLEAVEQELTDLELHAYFRAARHDAKPD